MGDFDPFGAGTSEPSTEMPVFGSFDLGPKVTKDELPTFGSFATRPGNPAFPSLPSFDSFDTGPEALPPKSSKMVSVPSTLSLCAALNGVEKLLKPLPGDPVDLDFDPNLARVQIPPPPRFSETVLAKELAEYCQKEFNHTFVFSD
jgi:hypothetical protein